MALSFTKMTAIGNDFIVVDGRVFDFDSISPIAEKLCDRRFGIGGDGVIFILPGTDSADFTMRIINSDGSEPEMCGNGIRCFARWLDDCGEFLGESIAVATGAGVLTISRDHRGYRVNMGKPILDPALIPVTAEQSLAVAVSVPGFDAECTAVSMGNPHAVFFVDQISDEQVTVAGPLIEKNGLFPRKTNVEFIRVINDSEVEMRVWERGCGETLACGTGACAAVVAGIRNNRHGCDVTVHLRGGDLQISWDGSPQSPVFMTGPAHTVFAGTIEI